MSQPGVSIVYILERKRPNERTFWPMLAGARATFHDCRNLQKERELLYPENRYRVMRYEAVKP